MTKNITEEELLLRKRARRRLVGAIVLVIFSVIVLPIIFDEPKSDHEQHEITINLPTFGKNNKNDRGLSPTEKLARNETSDKVDLQPPSQDKPKINSLSTEEITETVSERKRVPIPDIKPKATSRYPVETKKINTTNTADATNSAPVTAEAAKELVIQLGAFSDQLKAKQQLEILIANGFKAYTEVLKTGNNEVTRVRIGPFMTRDAAENELKKLKKLGFNGVVASR
jgi:DedD protein